MKSVLLQLLLVVAIVIVGVSQAQTPNSEAVITASPTVLSTTGDFVELKWTGMTSPTPYDIIAIYYPPESNPLTPIGFLMMSNATSWKQGYGSVSVPLVNVRSEYVFRVWTPGNSTGSMKIKGLNFTTVATSNQVTFENLNEPSKAYLSLTNITSEMRLMFVSGTNDTPVAYYGTDPSNLDHVAYGTTVTYSITQMCAAPANDTDYFRDPGYIHDIVMAGLNPASQYFYQFGSKGSGMSANTYNFMSAPELGTEAFIVAFGDLGLQTQFIGNLETQPPSIKTVANIYTTVTTPPAQSSFFKKIGKEISEDSNIPPPWNIHHIGDISYARGKAFVWDYYHDMIEEVASMSSWQVTIGNHEYDYVGQPFAPSWSNYGSDSGGECGVPYSVRYHMQGAEGTPQRNLWYSYNYGTVHFVIMSAEHDFLVGSDQYNWIVQDLESVNRTLTPWVIFTGHRPIYGSSWEGSEVGMYKNLQETYEPLLLQYDVNLCLTGHVHTYERMCGMYNLTCAPTDNDAPVHIVIGMAGNTYQTTWDGSDIKDGSGHEDQPPYSIFRASAQYGYTRLYANMTDLYFEFVGNNRNQVHDSLWLHSKYA
ncbi:hypothetical protein DFA_05535 [Cavenderia fasciculata]|uniref:Purple acid phosphatase n=1 Tax=Cavenderia fasciculata TaxID=261658 RepID=F4PLI1_CACFS|nr:uncharacterized protein DFA_05535 [Cavenderia fasciculata]EGG23403.1 hypothetical protein DFA_05535 [Cavenderia fasciculata]|eukprot:XP_004361254.1 hypothetical protein DFA_05535 [Cavenderia fasciculata]